MLLPALPFRVHTYLLHSISSLCPYIVLIAQQNPSSQTQVAPYRVWVSRTDSDEQQTAHISPQDLAPSSRAPGASDTPLISQQAGTNPKTTHTITDCQETTTINSHQSSPRHSTTLLRVSRSASDPKRPIISCGSHLRHPPFPLRCTPSRGPCRWRRKTGPGDGMNEGKLAGRTLGFPGGSPPPHRCGGSA